MNLISLNDTVEKVCNDKPIMNWITDKFTNSLSDDFNTSTFGKPFEISDKAIYFQCRGDANMNRYIVANKPNMSANQTHQFKLTRARFYKYIDKCILNLIEGFPLRDAPDRSQPKPKRAKKEVKDWENGSGVDKRDVKDWENESEKDPDQNHENVQVSKLMEKRFLREQLEKMDQGLLIDEKVVNGILKRGDEKRASENAETTEDGKNDGDKKTELVDDSSSDDSSNHMEGRDELDDNYDIDDKGYSDSFKKLLFGYFPHITQTGVFIYLNDADNAIISTNEEDSNVIFNNFNVRGVVDDYNNINNR
jgi:hypothetical protein